MSTKTRDESEGKSNRIFISSSTSFGNFPKDEMTKFLEDMGSKDIKDIPFGLITSFEGKIIPNDNKDKVIINGFSSCHLNVLKQNGQAIADYLGRLDKINNFMKPYALRFSDKITITVDDYSGLFPDYVVQPAIESFDLSDFSSLTFELSTKKQRNSRSFYRTISEYCKPLGVVQDYASEETSRLFDFEKQKYEKRQYKLTIEIKKP